MGRPAEGYPFDWSVYEWLPGENANGTIDDLEQAAVDLAAFVNALRQVDTTGAHPRPSQGRGGPLAEGDEQVRRSIAQLGDRIDGDTTLRSWEESLNASAWHGREVWVHGDLLPGNLLVVDGRLSTVACRRSSTSAASTWAIPRVTCSLRGTSSQVTVACGSEPNSRSTTRTSAAGGFGRTSTGVSRSCFMVP
jgi:hypothetical protein